MKIVWSPTARRDLREVRRYIAQDNPAAADQTVRRILGTVRDLRRFPRIGHPGRGPGSQELVVPRTPFVVVYTVDEQSIEILAVIQGARRWP